MRAVAWSVWVFINFVFLGMCGFFYILCTQYWGYVERRHAYLGTHVNKGSNAVQHHIQYYPEAENQQDHENRFLENSVSYGFSDRKVRQSPFAKDRFHTKSNGGKDENTHAPSYVENPESKLREKIAKHKSQLLIQLRRVLHDESSVFKARGEGSNPYNVQYVGPRGLYDKKSTRELVCALKKKGIVRTVMRDDEPFKSMGYGTRFPSQPLFGSNSLIQSCAVVSSAGSLLGSNLGKIIDEHDVVLRFNHAPTNYYKSDVGEKTTIRVVNSQVVSKPDFDFLGDPIYQNVDIIAWDPSKYHHSMEQWYKSPDHDVFTSYFQHRLLHPNTNAYLLDPATLWNLWDYIQSFMPLRIRHNPPSSGFLGLATLLPYCAHVDMFEFVPSFRMTKRCHYYDNVNDMSCTFGVWHPLSAEKLLLLSMNIANDSVVFQDGFIRIPGYQTLGCSD